ncbi:MAG: outer membrane protein assembly factor BamA [Planctomycetes bacterium]|nr:outer membrane protein assembly factor BamA [Planctomycetota bacterium]
MRRIAYIGIMHTLVILALLSTAFVITALAQNDEDVMAGFSEKIEDFARITIGKVEFYVQRYDGRIEKIRLINGYPNFIKDIRWLRKYVRVKTSQVYNPLRSHQDIARLTKSGLFNEIHVYARKSDDNVNLRYVLRAKPVKEIKFVPENPVTESKASLKSRLVTREAGEYTQFNSREDIRILNTQRQNISHVTVYADIQRFPDGSFDDGIIVYYFFNENMFLSEVKFEGVELGNEKNIKKELESALIGFNNTDIIEQDIKRIKKYYNDEKGCYFTEVNYEIKKVRSGDRIKRILVFKVHEGPKTSVRSVTFKGIELLCPPEGDDFFKPPNQWWGLYYSSFFWISLDNVKRRPMKHILKGDSEFKPEELRRDCNRLEDWIRGHGWLDAHVYLEKIKFSDNRQNADVTFVIEPGPMYWVRSLTIRGNYSAIKKQDILKKLRVKPGMPYKQLYVDGRMFEAGYEGDKKKIIRLFEDIGYYNTSVKTEIVYVSPSQVDIIYTVKQSNRYKIGNINIHGNESTKDAVIRRLMSSRPGLYYSRTRLESDTARLLRTQFFELTGYGVRIIPRQATAPFDPQKYIDLDVEVREGDTGSFNFGVAYSTNNGVLLFIQITKRNFDIGNWSTFSGAGQTISLNLSPGIGDQQQYSLSFSEPHFMGSRFSYGFSITNSENAYTDYSQKDWIISTSWGYKLTLDLSANLTYKWNWFKASDVGSEAPPAIEQAEDALVMSSLGLELNWDKRDDIFFPTSGFNVVMSSEVAGRYLGGNIDLWRIGTRLSWSIPLFAVNEQDDVTFTVKGSFDWQCSYGEDTETPLLQRFYLGGAGVYKYPNMRGFAYRGVGPRDTDNPDYVVGGDTRVGGTAEIRYPLRKGLLYFILFLDIGQLQLDIDSLRTDHWNMSAGFGFRLRVPISPAPLALDFGFPIRMYSGDEEQVVSFTLGFSF